MKIALRIQGLGHALGSQVVSNTDLALSLGLKREWFIERTGIRERRICMPQENVRTLAECAVRAACEDAGTELTAMGHETVLLHIQNGLTCLTPPSGIVLAEALGLESVRVVAIDGVCAEPLVALEMAALLLGAERCDRVIICAAADFLGAIDPNDLATVGLFGAGAGALIIERGTNVSDSSLVHALRWETHTAYAHLGRLPVLGFDIGPTGVAINTGFYEMDGMGLARAALKLLPGVFSSVLQEAEWQRHDIDLVIAHQPNAKLLTIGVRALGLNPSTVPMPVEYLGNMGPASLLVNLALAKKDGLLMPGTKLLLMAFGLGFSCGVAAVEM